MSKALVIFTLFVGILVVAPKSEAAVGHVDTFKGINTLQNNPWDPRGNEIQGKDDTATTDKRDGSGKEVLPEPEQSESQTEE